MAIGVLVTIAFGGRYSGQPSWRLLLVSACGRRGRGKAGRGPWSRW